MLRHICNTWTFRVIFCLSISNLTLSAPVESKNDEAKTMYEALVHKCPSLEKSQLQDNLQDIFSKECVDWPNISVSTHVSKKERNDTACLLLYESLLSFCSKFGDHNIAMYKGLIPASNETAAIFKAFTIDEICLNNNTLKNSLNKTEHKIAELLEPTKCALLCGDLGESEIVLTNELCKFSFYFATMDVNKITNYSNAKVNKGSDPKSVNEARPEDNPPQQIPNPEKEVKGQQGNIKPVDAIALKPREPDVPPKVLSVNAVQPQNVNDKVDKIIEHVPVAKPAALEKGQHSVDIKENSDTQVKAPKPGHEQPVDTHFNSPLKDTAGKDEVKDAVVKPELNAENPQNAVEKPNESKVAAEADKNDLFDKPDANGDSQEVEDAKNPDDNVDDEDQGGFQEEEQKEEAKLKHGMPEEIDEKESSKDIKPSNTIEDEAVSNSNTDAMDGDSYFFSYFTVIMCLSIVGYVGYHNRQKIFALLLEGKKGRRPGRTGRRPNSANYHKLDSNLEEAISSSCTKNASNVIY